MIAENVKLIAIGCSAGCFESLLQILPNIPEPLRVPIVIVLHISPEKDSLLATTFRARCKVPVKEAEDKETIESSTIYFAPPGYHLQVETNGEFSLSSEEPVYFSRPSIDILFESVAAAYGQGALGIVLSGANEDGANGLRKISEAGGQVIVEDPAFARYPMMPAAAQAQARNAQPFSVPELSRLLSQFGGSHA